MAIRFGEKPTTEFVNSLDALKIELVDSPDTKTIRQAVYCFVKSTWADQHVPYSAATEADLSKTLEDVFAGRALPAAMELIGLTFLVGGIDTQTVTHLIRHRAGSLQHSAQVIAGSLTSAALFRVPSRTAQSSMLDGRLMFRRRSSSMLTWSIPSRSASWMRVTSCPSASRRFTTCV
jgi:hypothetical protein